MKDGASKLQRQNQRAAFQAGHANASQPRYCCGSHALSVQKEDGETNPSSTATKSFAQRTKRHHE